jgi:hypothetical protein
MLRSASGGAMQGRDREPDEPAVEQDGVTRPKDRIVQARVPRDLESRLKREASRRRLTVSHLVRNVLEDAFQLVDGVVANVDALVDDSVELVRRVGSDARRVAGAMREATPQPAAAPARDDDLVSVWAWNRVVLNRAVDCSRCGRRLTRGSEAHAGLRDEPGPPRAWLCGSCIEALAESEGAER